MNAPLNIHRLWMLSAPGNKLHVAGSHPLDVAMIVVAINLMTVGTHPPDLEL